MCQVHTGAYVSLLAPGKPDYTACYPRKTTTYFEVYIKTIKINSSGEIENFVETHLLQAVCDTPIARITGCVSSLRI